MTGLPEGLGRFEEIVVVSLALAAARELLARGEGSIEEVRSTEEALEVAARRLVSSEPSPPDAEWLEKHGESQRAGAEKLADEYRRKGSL